ncbi:MULTISPECIES: element excision factor XisH family protein [unclassified Microcoleus]|uniref:element excision factor XisH family protein n=1 Tax=unclassified Microcoleus TaxID=2642155 RepID=UPI002FD723F3
MPAKDRFHEAVKVALQKDGWTITDDPLTIPIERLSNLYIDFGAEKLLIRINTGCGKLSGFSPEREATRGTSVKSVFLN